MAFSVEEVEKGIALPDNCKMKSVEEDENKYLGILEYQRLL